MAPVPGDGTESDRRVAAPARMSPLTLRLSPCELEQEFWAANGAVYAAVDRWSLIASSGSLAFIMTSKILALSAATPRRVLLVLCALMAARTIRLRWRLASRPAEYHMDRACQLTWERALRGLFYLVSAPPAICGTVC